MAEIWIIGRKATLPNGHHHIAEPFIAFSTNKDAQEACDMIERVSGERPMIASASMTARRHPDPYPNPFKTAEPLNTR